MRAESGDEATGGAPAEPAHRAPARSAPARSSRAIRQWWRARPLLVRETLGWLAITRAGILLLSISAPLVVNPHPDYPNVWNAFLQWDVAHFKAIAEFGYAQGEPSGAPLAAFFPGLPLLLRLLHAAGIDYVLAGILISLAASAVAGVSLARLAEHEFPSLRSGLGSRTALLWFAAPVGVFLAAPYTEALFCALAFPAWLAARRGRWIQASMLVALSCTVRISGVFLAAALAVEFLTSRKRDWHRLPWLMVPAIPVLGFAAYLHSIHGTWKAWQLAQEKGWEREFTRPWNSVWHTVEAAQRGHFSPDRTDWTWMFRAELVALLVGLALLTWLLARRSWGEAVWIATTLGAFATSFWLYSLTRATLLWWPLWIGLAVLAERRPWLGRLYLGLALPLAALWAASFFTGRWSG